MDFFWGGSKRSISGDNNSLSGTECVSLPQPFSSRIILENGSIVPDVYKRIYDKVFMSNHKISWPKLLRESSWDTGMYPKEFLKRFKRSRKIFLSAKKDVKADEEVTRKYGN